ncbi:MAG: metallophosphoesterase [Gemmatimonadota bacterium]
MLRTLLIVGMSLTLAGCPTKSAENPGALFGDRGASMEATPFGPAILIAAGDIADCRSDGDESSAILLDSLRGTIAVLGDNAYPSGSDANYERCYDPTWGRQKARTRPTPGNHEYRTADAGGYFRYFGKAAGDPDKGWYSYDLGDWHIIVLNSNSNCEDIRCDARSEQVKWLRDDLSRNKKLCTLAYWHHPRFNSGARHGNSEEVIPFWRVLYENGADVVLNGHEHLYERFARQTPDGDADPARGIRQFTVGTGGRDKYRFGTIKPNSEVRAGDTGGVLRLELHDDSYKWEFMPIAGEDFRDSGSERCH